MFSSFTTRFRSLIWFFIFTFSLYCVPHLELLFPYEVHLYFSEAEGQELSPLGEIAPATDIPADVLQNPENYGASSATSDALEVMSPGVSFNVDDFTGAAHLSYPIVVPPGRNGLSPTLSLNYSSSGGNGWIGVAWDLSVGYIQRKRPRKAVPKYDSTDIFELSLGGSPQELVSVGGGAYRLKIEGAYLDILYSGNSWQVRDKSGIKMTFGSTAASRLDNGSLGTYRWCLNKVEDPKANYMDISYNKYSEDPGQIYLYQIQYNANSSATNPSLGHNHVITFNLEARSDPVYNGRGGFVSKTQKRLSSVEIRTNGAPVRKYVLQYSNPTNTSPRSLLSSIILYGNDYLNPNSVPLPPTVFTYQTNAMGFNETLISWANPSTWLEGYDEYGLPIFFGNYLRDNLVNTGSLTDLIDINGDGLLERIVYDKTDPYNTWSVYQNDLQGFTTQANGNPWSWSNTSWPLPQGGVGDPNYIRSTSPSRFDLVDMDGDGFPDRVVYNSTSACHSPFNTNCDWSVYLNNGSNGFTNVSSPNWRNPSAWGPDDGNQLRNRMGGYGYYTDIIDMNGDGLPDRVVYERSCPSPYTGCQWKVYLNSGTGFNAYTYWDIPNPSNFAGGVFIRNIDSNGTRADLIDMNGDGLPDRVVYNIACDSTHLPGYDYHSNCPWTVYFNNGTGFDAGISWPNPSAYGAKNGNYIRNTSDYGAFTELIDMNGDGLPDRVVFDSGTPGHWSVYLNNGSGFLDAIQWPYQDSYNYIRRTTGNNTYTGVYADVYDIDGDGLPDRVVSNSQNCNLYSYQPPCPWSVYLNKGPVTDLLSTVNNGIGGTIQIAYAPSTDYDNTGSDGKSHLPFTVQTVKTYTKTDGRIGGGSYVSTYTYSGGYYEPSEAEFRGFKNVTSCQPNCDAYESMTQTTYLQDSVMKGKVLTQLLTSKEGHTREVDNTWVAQDMGNGIKFPRLDETISKITDVGTGGPFSYNHATQYTYDSTYLNVITEKKGQYVGSTFTPDIVTDFSYMVCTSSWILSKPTMITVKDGSGQIASRKWMSYYDCTMGNLWKEEVCRSDTPNSGCSSQNSTQNPVITYQYHDNTSDNTYNLKTITDPMNYTTSMAYDSTKTHVYNTTNALGHITTTEYDPGTGNLTKLISPHLQNTQPQYWYQTQYDVFGRKIRERFKDNSDPNADPTVDRGWTYYSYDNYLGNPNSQYSEKIEHIVVEGQSQRTLEHHTQSYFDGMGRTYWVASSGSGGRSIVTETEFDTLGRVWKKSIPYYSGDYAPWTAPRTTTTYDGLSRVTNVNIPDYPQYRNIVTMYQGLKKIVTNQRNISAAYTYDVYQRLKKVEEDYNISTGGSYSTTQYSYDTLGNLTQVIAALGATEQNTTTMTYDSLSKKRWMTDPDMGTWEYRYDKSGNLLYQKDNDPNRQAITFDYDGLNRVSHKYYPGRTVTFTYDDAIYPDPAVPYSKGKLIKVSDPSGGETKEDSVLVFDVMQRTTSTKKKIGTEEAIFGKTYDSAGRTVSITYPGTGNRTYSYEYDVAGNLLYLKDPAGNPVASYSGFTALGQPGTVSFPKSGGGSVTTAYTYIPETGRLFRLFTDGLLPGSQALNDITHDYTYDNLNRLSTAVGAGTTYYNHTYTYDRIGNIKTKPDVEGGSQYNYDYTNKPHAVRSVGTLGNLMVDYDYNGNMTQKYHDGITTTITWNYDNKPISISRTGGTTVSYTYDGNGQRVKKVSGNSTVFYFGSGYEKRNGTGIIHLFAGNQRVASVVLDTYGNPQYTQIYHPDHLGSSWLVTDQTGTIKEKNEFYPYGTYITSESFDSSPNFPATNYTFTSQEDELDEVGFYNYGARLYDPVLGRFISPDSIVPYPGDPQTLNRYSYCANNPLIYTDPSGHLFGIDDIYFIIGAIVLSAAYGGATAHSHGMDWWAGAFVGGVTAGLAAGAGFVFGGVAGAWASNVLTWVMDTGSSAYGSAVGIIGVMGGGFAGGATGGFYGSGVYGGDPWKGALYGGLTGAAMAGLVQGAIELNNWANSTPATISQESNTDTSNMVAGPGDGSREGHVIEDRGQASYYNDSFEGKRTSTGEIFRQDRTTAAMHYDKYRIRAPVAATVEYMDKEGNVINCLNVRVNDHGPWVEVERGEYVDHPTRIIDLSKSAFRQLVGTLKPGVVDVRVTIWAP